MVVLYQQAGRPVDRIIFRSFFSVKASARKTDKQLLETSHTVHCSPDASHCAVNSQFALIFS